MIYGGAQMKLYNVAKQSWWVPAIHPQAMAVRIQTPEEFLQAIKAKMLALADKTQQGQREYLAQITPGADPEPLSLVTALLGQVGLGEAIAENNPETGAEPADEATALEAIASQGELTLADYLA